ncbi:hypothetical protein OQI89_13425 [Lentilactobacillus diolivorans]|uniref:hypothetical protein n=1 Tax=Lentilactobacillus diolivorans TaxID=179838 RepID=UPI00246921DC|nr:hypothetical protein [Lentilactobacillus diolivorans]MDH5106854.1 hypothetical protein [Lentilactobacillus diolivorans]
MAGSCGSFARLDSVTPNTINIPDFGILAWGTYMAGGCGSFARLDSAAQTPSIFLTLEYRLERLIWPEAAALLHVLAW